MFNLVLIIPFIKFLIWPEANSIELIASAIYILGLRVTLSIAFSTSIDYIVENKRKFLYALMPAIPLIYYAYLQIGVYPILYLFLGVIFDLYSRKNETSKENLARFEQTLAKLFLLMFLFVPSMIIASLIYSNYQGIIIENYETVTNSKDAENFTTYVVLFISYYIIEPFAFDLYLSIFGSKGKIRSH